MIQQLQSLATALSAVLLQPRTGLLVALLVAAAVIDVRAYRVPNALTVTGMLAGLAIGTFTGATLLQGFLMALGGLAAGLLLLMPLHMLRVLGAGDVKLMAAVGAFLGWHDLLGALVFVLVTGGLVALGVAVARRASRRAAANLGLMVRAMALSAMSGVRVAPGEMVSAGRIPYAVCIALGTTAYLVVQQLVSA